MFSPEELTQICTNNGFHVLQQFSKTVLPVRHHEAHLKDPANYKTLMELELKLNKLPSAIGIGHHLEIICQKPL
jgi:hypothetical protein